MTGITKENLRDTLRVLLKLNQYGRSDEYLTADRIFLSLDYPSNLGEYRDGLEKAVEMGLLDKVVVDWHIRASGHTGYRPKKDRINEILEIIRGGKIKWTTTIV